MDDCLLAQPALQWRMPKLTRRSSDHREEWWEIYYGDIHAGTISERAGNPFDTEPWEWRCGFYPGSRPCECTGTAETSTKPAPTLKPHGRCSWPTEPRPTFRPGAIRKPGRPRSIAGSLAESACCQLGVPVPDRTFTRVCAIICGLVLNSACAGAADNLTGQASVIDGDTLEIHGTLIRLWGVDAPQSSQLCRGGYFSGH